MGQACDQLGGFASSASGGRRERAHLSRDRGEPLAVLVGPGGLNGGVQREEPRLTGDLGSFLREGSDLLRDLAEFRDRSRSVLHVALQRARRGGALVELSQRALGGAGCAIGFGFGQRGWGLLWFRYGCRFHSIGQCGERFGELSRVRGALAPRIEQSRGVARQAPADDVEGVHLLPDPSEHARQVFQQAVQRLLKKAEFVSPCGRWPRCGVSRSDPCHGVLRSRDPLRALPCTTLEDGQAPQQGQRLQVVARSQRCADADPLRRPVVERHSREISQRSDQGQKRSHFAASVGEVRKGRVNECHCETAGTVAEHQHPRERDIEGPEGVDLPPAVPASPKQEPKRQVGQRRRNGDGAHCHQRQDDLSHEAPEYEQARDRTQQYPSAWRAGDERVEISKLLLGITNAAWRTHLHRRSA